MLCDLLLFLRPKFLKSQSMEQGDAERCQKNFSLFVLCSRLRLPSQDNHHTDAVLCTTLGMQLHIRLLLHALHDLSLSLTCLSHCSTGRSLIMGMKYRDYSTDSGEEYEGTRRRRGERRILSDSKSKKSLSDFQFERPDPITAAKTKANRERQRRERLNERCIVSPTMLMCSMVSLCFRQCPLPEVAQHSPRRTA